ncbi:MAG: hypothetical protein Q9219_003495 [cf. Caloplaca sp. 3 TL-2023]
MPFGMMIRQQTSSSTPFTTLLLSTLCLTLLPLLTQARVTVSLDLGNANPHPFVAIMHRQVCTSLRPGDCCFRRNLGAAIGILRGGGGGGDGGLPVQDTHEYRQVQWQGLEALDIAFVWQPQGQQGGCSGRPADSKTGPGAWRYPQGGGDSAVPITGASYVKLPTRLPDKATARVPWMEMQGIVGLVSGGRMWNTPQATGTSLLLQMEAAKALAGGGGGRRRRGKRDLGAGWQGEVREAFVQPSGRLVSPDLIVVNGTEYKEEGPGSPVYRSGDGRVLDFTGV